MEATDAQVWAKMIRRTINMTMTLVLVLLGILGSGCGERKTEVQLQGGNPPAFNLSGSGNLVALSIGIQSQDKSLVPSKRITKIWEIVPTRNDGKPVESIGEITYGIVPDGYRQTIPTEGRPPSLTEANYYRYYFETINAPHATGTFEIKNGRAGFMASRFVTALRTVKRSKLRVTRIEVYR